MTVITHMMWQDLERLVGSIIHSGSKEDEYELKPKCNSFYCQECFHLIHFILNHLNGTFALLKNFECSNHNFALAKPLYFSLLNKEDIFLHIQNVMVIEAFIKI